MKWRFTIDSTDFPGQVIDEPAGWDQAVINLKRDVVKHGIFFDYGFAFKYYNNSPSGGFNELKYMWLTYGVEAVMTLKIEALCNPDPENGWLELYFGRLNFTIFKATEGLDCFVEIPVETPGCLMQFNNLFDQQVDIQKLTSKNGSSLVPYIGLGAKVNLPSKGIYKQVSLINKPDNFADYAESQEVGAAVERVIILEKNWKLYFDKEVLTEIDTLDNNGLQYFDSPGDVTPIFTCTESADYNVDIAVSLDMFFGALTDSGLISNGVGRGFAFYYMELFLDINGTFTSLGSKIPGFVNYPGKTTCDPPDSAHDTLYNLTYTNVALHLNQGDTIKLYLTTRFGGIYSNGTLSNLGVDFCERILMKAEDDTHANHFKLTVVDHVQASAAKVFMVNEVLSRITENITDDCLRVYSDYYGRLDAKPYASPALGCGGNRCITTGLFIRQFGTPIISLSFKDMWEGLSPIDNIGIGIEPDPNRPGEFLIRVERMEYFYQSNTIVLQLDKAPKVEIQQVNDNIFTNLKIGYSKWEAEQFSGLDEFNTDRDYITDTTVLSKTLSIISKFIASGYAIEITRRLKFADTSTQDWRYDNDNFIICLQKQDCFINFFDDGEIAFSFDLPSAWLNTTFKAGDIITFSGTASNDNTYTVVSWDATSNTMRVVMPPNLTTELFVHGVTITLNGVPLPSFFYEAEIGNIDTPANLIEPSTVYNFRLSPVRNMMRWMQTLMNNYHDPTTGKFRFVTGTGNYLASGRVNDGCEWPAASLAENQTIQLTDFDDPLEGTPLWDNYLLKLDYPMTVQDYINLKINMYGIIQVRWGNCATDFIDFWLKELNYKANTCIATFTLIPRSSFLGEGLGIMVLGQAGSGGLIVH